MACPLSARMRLRCVPLKASFAAARKRTAATRTVAWTVLRTRYRLPTATREGRCDACSDIRWRSRSHRACCRATAPAAAQTAEEFYKGKQIRFVVGTATGQDYDLWARLIGRHITRHIPGRPTLIVENMPGAGHIMATNYLFNVAPKDGTVIGMVSRNMTDAAVMKLPNVRYDPAKFNWLGSPEINHRVMFVSAASGIDERAGPVRARADRRRARRRAGRHRGAAAAQEPARHEAQDRAGLSLARRRRAGGRARRGRRLRQQRRRPGGRAAAMGRDRADARPVQHGAGGGGVARRAHDLRFRQDRRAAAGADLLRRQHAARPPADGAAGRAGRAGRGAAPRLRRHHEGCGLPQGGGGAWASRWRRRPARQIAALVAAAVATPADIVKKAQQAAGPD